MESNFLEITQLIKYARNNALKTVNTEIINLYWIVGLYIEVKIKISEWGDKTVSELAGFIQNYHSELKGFNRAGLYRMVQLYETYCNNPIVAPTRRQLEHALNQKIQLSPQCGDNLKLKIPGVVF